MSGLHFKASLLFSSIQARKKETMAETNRIRTSLSWIRDSNVTSPSANFLVRF